MENSKILLQNAIQILKEAGARHDSYAIGGGTILALYFNHRLSKDIDVFLSDSQLLSGVSPRLNAVAEDALDYKEDGQFISLTFPEGKIDFIVSGKISKFPDTERTFQGLSVFVEDAVEIVAKKIYYRGSSVKPRDLFDLAVVYNSPRKKDLIKTLQAIPKETRDFFKYYDLAKKNSSYIPYSTSTQESILAGGKAFIGKEFILCDALKHDIQRNFSR